MEEIKKDNNIKLKNKSSLGYKGNVTISFLKKGKVVKKLNTHNLGTPVLFQFLLNCLKGDYFSDDRPQWVRTFKQIGLTKVYCQTQSIPIGSTNISGEGNDLGLTYSILLPNITIRNISPSTEKIISGIVFYSQSNNPSDEVGNPINESSCSMILDFGEDINLDEEDVLVSWQVNIFDVSNM